MKHLLARFGISLALTISLVAGIAAPAYAICGQSANSSAGQVLSGAGVGQTTTDCGSGVTSLASSVVSILSLIVGIAAVIMIIVAGLKYITSGGDSNSVSSAKNTLVYALVGVAVAALAQALVHFVLAKAKT